jgi:autotransporter translocation and assembly factor TamB
MATRRGIVRRMVLGVAILGTAVVAMTAILTIASQTPWFREWLKGVIESEASKRLGGDLTVGEVGGNLLTGIRLQNVALLEHGHPIIQTQSIEAEYQPQRLLAGELTLDSLVITAPIVYLRRTADGLNLARLLDPGTSTVQPGRSSVLLAIGQIQLRDGVIVIGDRVDTLAAIDLPERVSNLDAQFEIYRPSGSEDVVLRIQEASFRTRAPDLQIDKLAGRVSFGTPDMALENLRVETQQTHLLVGGTVRLGPQPRVDLNVRSTNFSLSEIGPLFPALAGRTLSPSFAVSIAGTPSALVVKGAAHTSEGEIRADVVADLTGPRRAIAGWVSTESLNLAAFDTHLESSDITASGRVDLTFESGTGVAGTYDIEASELTYGRYRATDVSAEGRMDADTIVVDAHGGAYHGDLRVKGSITLPQDGDPVRYDLRGHVAGIDLERASRDLNVPEAGTAWSGGASGSATLDFHATAGPAGVKTDLRLEDDLSFAGASFREGTAIEISTRSGRLKYSIDGSISNLDLTALGARLGVPTLESQRYASTIDAVVDLEGTGTSLEDLTLNGTATLTNSRLFGGTIPKLFVRTAIAQGAGHISVEGAFSGIDAARLAGSAQLPGSLSGTIDAQATLSDRGGEFSLAGVEGSGRIVLSNSTLRGIPIDTAVVAGHYHDRIATVSTVVVKGPDLEVRLSGVLALDREHASDLSYYIDTPPLSRVDFIDATVHGEVVVQGRVTGNLNAFQATGTLAGVDIGYAQTSALALNSKYTVAVPNLRWARVGGSVESDVTSVRVAGRTIPEVHATMVYDDGQLDFDAHLREAGRGLEAAGALVWHANHHEVHLDRLRLESGPVEWRLAENTHAAIQYGADRLVVDGLELRGGFGGRIRADGAIGPTATKRLRLQIEDIDLKEIDSLLLGDRGLAGQLDVTADVTGPLSAPVVEGHFALADGAFERFTFDTLVGQFDYSRRALGLDARLVAQDGSWLTMAGRVPFAGGGEGGALDLRLRSSRISLGVVQGFTNQVADVTGTIQLDVVASGSYEDPHFRGEAHIEDGAFTAVAAGSRYTGLDTRVRFEQDIVRIEEFRILDDDGDPMTIGGELAVHERHVGGLQIRIQSHAFEILDNALGEIEVAADLQIGGEPTRPRFTGRIELASGTLSVDRILDLADTPYATRAVSAEPIPSRDTGVVAVAADVLLEVPGNLVLKGTDIQAPGGSVPTGLGNVNLTIGGNLRVRKEPGKGFEVLGDVRPVRGTYEFQGREFEIQREGAIVFAGTPDINPTLDLLATRLISGVEARVHLNGTLETPRLELSSQPPLDDADILALIVFNRPLNQLGTGEQISLAQRAAAVAAGFVGSQLAQPIGEALGLDVFDIDIGGATAPSVVLGEQFARGVFLKFRQQLASSATSSFLLEYELTDWLRLRGEINQAQVATRSLFDRSERGAIKLQFTFRY